MTTDFAYDSASRLTLISHKKPDGTGNRTAKTVNRRTERYLYDGDEILCDYDKNGSFAAMYVNGPIIDERLALLRDGQLYYYLTDHLGSVRQLIDSTGSMRNLYEYEAFGAELRESEAVKNAFRFAGAPICIVTNLVNLRYRSYYPVAGVYLSNDPLFEIFPTQSYAFTFQNPLRNRDPYGLCPDKATPEKPDDWPEIAEKAGELIDEAGGVIQALEEELSKALEGGSTDNVKLLLKYITNPNSPPFKIDRMSIKAIVEYLKQAQTKDPGLMKLLSQYGGPLTELLKMAAGWPAEIFAAFAKSQHCWAWNEAAFSMLNHCNPITGSSSGCSTVCERMRELVGPCYTDLLTNTGSWAGAVNAKGMLEVANKKCTAAVECLKKNGR